MGREKTNQIAYNQTTPSTVRIKLLSMRNTTEAPSERVIATAADHFIRRVKPPWYALTILPKYLWFTNHLCNVSDDRAKKNADRITKSNVGIPGMNETAANARQTKPSSR